MTGKETKTGRDKTSCIRSSNVPKRPDPLILIQSVLCPHHQVSKKILLPPESTYYFLLLSWDFYLSFIIRYSDTLQTMDYNAV